VRTYGSAMNAIPDQPILPPAPAGWDAIYASVNAWRGECMHHFSVAEYAVTETLLALDGAKPEGATIQLRHLIGQRFEDLAAAIGPDGPFAENGKSAAGTLAVYRERHEAFRTQLCHGRINVSVQCSGQWVLVLRGLTISKRQVCSDTVVLEQALAEGRLRELKRDGQRLAVSLGQLRKAVSEQLPKAVSATS